MVLSCLDGISDSVAGMQTQTTPYNAGAESQPTSLAGEIERLRYVLSNVFGFTYWYRRDQNVDFATGTQIQGSGLGRHVTAVGLHTWAGSLQWPAITSVATHTSGIFWPLAHHMVIGFDATANQGAFGAGQTNARSYYWFHAAAMTLHHTAALRFASSEGPMDGGQRGHVTALRVAPGTTGVESDRLVFGHAGSTLAVEGSGITGGISQVLAVAASGALSTIAGASVGLWGSRGQSSGTGFTADGGHVFTLRAHIVQLMDASNHALVLRVGPPNVSVNISDILTGDAGGATPNGRDRKATLDANTWVHFYWIWHAGSSLLRGVASPDAPTAGPNLPTGFSAWSYAGTVRRGATLASPLVATHIAGSISYYGLVQNALSAGTATSETLVNLSSLVPPTALATLLHLGLTVGSVDATTAVARIRVASGQDVLEIVGRGSGTYGTRESIRGSVRNLSERIFYLFAPAGNNTPTITIDVVGYENPSGG